MDDDFDLDKDLEEVFGLDEEDTPELEDSEKEPEKASPRSQEAMKKRAAGARGNRKRKGLPPTSPKTGPKRSKKEVIQALHDAEGFEQRAAANLGITFSTWKNYKKKWPRLEILVQEYRRAKIEDVAEAGYREALNGNDRMQRFILDRQKIAEELGFVKQYKENQTTNVQVNIGDQISIQLTDDVKTQLVDRIKRKRLSDEHLRRMDEGLALLEEKKTEQVIDAPAVITPDEKKEQS